jgi:hypothetical protein
LGLAASLSICFLWRAKKCTNKARQAGARLLLFGGIHKMSTLIQWAKVQAVDLQTEKLVFDRLLTFRGDTDDAWRRTEVFVAEQMTTLDVDK